MRVLAVVFLLGACSETPFDDTKVDSYIRGLGTTSAPAPKHVVDDEFGEFESGDYNCVTDKISETRRYDRVVALSANSESLWPGAIVRGDSIDNGLFTQIPFDRKPMSFSVSLSNLDGDKSVTLYSPKLSTYRDAVDELMNQTVKGDTPANLYAEIEKVHSQEQLGLALGLNVSWLGGSSVKSSFDFSREEIHSRYLVKYTQTYFTVDADPPKNPGDYISDVVTIDEVKEKVTEPPLYVSSISHGRIVVFTFESTHSSKELEAALEFVYNGGVEIDGQVSLTHQEVLSQSNITAYILGGSGEMAAQSIDSFESLMSFIKQGGNYSPESPGAAIAYKLSHLADNSPARFSLLEEYEEVKCERARQKVRVTLENLRLVNGGNEGDLELYGRIEARAETTAVLFNKTSSQHVPISDGQTWPSQGSISDLVIDVVPMPGEEVIIDINLRDRDGWGSDDVVGNQITIAPYEIGWRREVKIPLTGSGATLEANLSLQPI